MAAISFPASPSNNDTFTANGKTWQWNGTFWSLVVSGATVADGSVSTAKIADSAITAAKIADGTVVAAEIASGAITNAKLATDAVHSVNIAAGAVTAAKLGDDISLTPADGSITQAKLASNLSAVTVTTTANRDTDIPSPFTGQLAVLTDTKKIQLYDGTSWLNITLAPPEPPTSLSATALSTTSVSIAFTPGSENGSAITNYKYALSTNSGSTYGSFTAVNPADTTSPITISGLTQNTAYYIKLKAVNAIGDSVESAAVTVTTLNTVTVDYVVSSGGGGGAAYEAGGGGGGGGYRHSYGTASGTGLSGGGGACESPLTANLATNYTVTVGAGGAGGYPGANGSNSVFSTVTSIGGGGGGGFSSPSTANAGVAGGCGGGGGGAASGGAGTANQGYGGGTGYNSSGGSGGGGGAGSAGSGTTPGVGVASSITGTSVTRNRGGGYSSGTAAANTGNGGGGAQSYGGSVQQAGSGIVILRYPSSFTITIGAGLTGSTATDGSFKVTSLTAGSGNVSWA